ncbi:MAG: hypothetical protein U0136_18835 [Bdellovibrionota bacterium]
MFRRRQKFYAIWTIVACLAITVPLRNVLMRSGYASFDALFQDALWYAVRASFVLIPFCAIVLFSRVRAAKRPPPPLKVLGRTAICFQCKRKLIEFNGSNCQMCGWIRCPCGACGCGVGKLA